MGNAIPTKQRTLVKERDHERCQRCGMAGHDWHHRKRRRGSDPHRHCTCIGITLCRSCHAWAHNNPTAALDDGFRVSAWEDHPAVVPIKTFHGLTLNDCQGGTESFQLGKIESTP